MECTSLGTWLRCSVADPRREVLERKLAILRQFLTDLEGYARLDTDGRRREHYAMQIG